MDSPTLAEFAALRAAIVRVLLVCGIDLGATSWLRPLGHGLFEFRIRHDAATIDALYATSVQSDQEARKRLAHWTATAAKRAKGGRKG